MKLLMRFSKVTKGKDTRLQYFSIDLETTEPTLGFEIIKSVRERLSKDGWNEE